MQGGGKKPHKPTEVMRRQVEAMSAYGIPQADIALVIGIDRNTLMKHYRTELDTAKAKANSKVAERLYQKAIEGDTSSMIFWLKTRARWKETSHLEVTGEDGGPVDHSITVKYVD